MKHCLHQIESLKTMKYHVPTLNIFFRRVYLNRIITIYYRKCCPRVVDYLRLCIFFGPSSVCTLNHGVYQQLLPSQTINYTHINAKSCNTHFRPYTHRFSFADQAQSQSTSLPPQHFVGYYGYVNIRPLARYQIFRQA